MGVVYPTVQPEALEIEVSLLGGGGGYGESLLIHYGDGKWIIVDSLTDPRSQAVLPLDYLQAMGIDPAQQVRAVVATHWHDDHVRGLSKVVETCPAARFICTGALENSQFLTLVGLDSYVSNASKSGVSEFRQILENKQEGGSIFRALADRLLLKDQLSNGAEVTLWALSPNDATVDRFAKELAPLIEQATHKRAIKAGFSNHVSVVLLLKVGEWEILLGADLEETNDPRTGWQAIMATTACPKEPNVSLFKIPHHGSENGHYRPLWDQVLIQQEPALMLTPYARGKKKLPSPPDVERILAYSSDAFITSFPTAATRNRPKRRDSRTNKAIADLGLPIKERKFEYGHIQCRRPLAPKRARWKTQIAEFFSKSQKPMHGWDIRLSGGAKRLPPQSGAAPIS